MERWTLIDEGHRRGRLETPHGTIRGEVDALSLLATHASPRPDVIRVDEEPPLVGGEWIDKVIPIAAGIAVFGGLGGFALIGWLLR